MTTMLIAAAVSVATNLTTTLPTVVVEASRTGKAPMELAQHVETIGEAQIAASDAKNLPELAARIPGLNVYNLGAGNPALAQIQMRGYGEPHVPLAVKRAIAGAVTAEPSAVQPGRISLLP